MIQTNSIFSYKNQSIKLLPNILNLLNITIPSLSYEQCRKPKKSTKGPHELVFAGTAPNFKYLCTFCLCFKAPETEICLTFPPWFFL